MADTQIDELRLDITVEDKTSGESSSKKVRNLATAISRLNKNLQTFDTAKFTKVFDDMSKGIDPFTKKIKSVSTALASLAVVMTKGGLAKAVKEISGKTIGLKTETVSTDNRKATFAQELQAETEKLPEENIKNIGAQLSFFNKQVDETAKKTEKAKKPLGQLLKSFGRIAMYRAVRRTIQEITQAFMESIDGIARYNSEFRDTMGSLQSSMDKVKASMGVAFYQVLILLEPLITQIANGIVNLANSLAKVTANMRGVGKYTKINTDYMKEYQSAVKGTLLAFDTFTTLSSNEQYDPSKMFIMGEDADNLSNSEERLKNILSIISNIANSIKDIWIEIKPSIEPILQFIANVLAGIGKLVKLLKDKNLLTPALTGLLTAITALQAPFLLIIGLVGSIIDSFSKMSTKTKVLTGIVAGLAAALAAIATPGGAIAKTIAATLTFAGISAIVANAQNTTAYANGGMFEGAGTMYKLAGESGAEVVAQGSAGTGVLNVDQFADAMVSALVRYGAARDTGSGTTIILDGNKVGQLVASNVGFRNEANRRNANLNWK